MNESNQFNWQRTNLDNIEKAWEGDLWERKRLGLQLERYVDRLQCGAVLALDARWGEGKTWFVRHWEKHLSDTDHKVIYLDAFANDYLEDPFLVIASEIASKLDKTADKKLVHKFKKAAAVMQQGLLSIAPTLIASMISCAITGGIIPFIKIDNEKIVDKLDDAIDKVTDNIGEKVTEAIQNKIETYEEEKNSLVAFKSTLAELAESLDKPLVFIIDELDRCRPDFAIRLIERIKHFFDIPKIVFVLVMDKNQFSKVVCHNYGYDQTLSEEYLDKFVDFSVGLNFVEKHEESMSDIIKDKLKRLGFDLNNVNLVGCVELLIYYIKKNRISKRSVSKIINQFSLLSLQNFDSCKNQLLIIFLINRKYLQVENTLKLYEILILELNDFIGKNTIEFQEFNKTYEGSNLPLLRVQAMFFEEKNNINIFEELAKVWFNYNNSSHPSAHSGLNARNLRPNTIPELLESWINYLDCGI